MPRGTNAPKLLPADPTEVDLDGVIGQALAAVDDLRDLVAPSMVPTVRLTLRMGMVADDTGRAVLQCAGRAQLDQPTLSSARSRP